MSTCADPSTTTSHFLDEKNHIQEGGSMLIEATKNKLRELQLEPMTNGFTERERRPSSDCIQRRWKR